MKKDKYNRGNNLARAIANGETFKFLYEDNMMNMINYDEIDFHKFDGMTLMTLDKYGNWVEDSFDIEILQNRYISFQQFIPQFLDVYWYWDLKCERNGGMILKEEQPTETKMFGNTMDIINIHFGNCYKTKKLCLMDKDRADEIVELHKKYIGKGNWKL